jgi:hypothetical protein
MEMYARGWLSFGAWALAGAPLCMTLIGAASIGIFVAPFALLTLWLVARKAGTGPPLFGLLTGAGAPVLAVGIAELDAGGFNGRLWLVVGAALIAAGIAGSAATRRRAQPPSAVV